MQPTEADYAIVRQRVQKILEVRDDVLRKASAPAQPAPSVAPAQPAPPRAPVQSAPTNEPVLPAPTNAPLRPATELPIPARKLPAQAAKPAPVPQPTPQELAGQDHAIEQQPARASAGDKAPSISRSIPTVEKTLTGRSGTQNGTVEAENATAVSLPKALKRKNDKSNDGTKEIVAATSQAQQDLVGFRRAHILNRHKAGAGYENKTEFPAAWSDSQIIEAVNQIANDPHAASGIGKYNSPWKTGVIDGVKIKVDFYPVGHKNYDGKVSTAYPIELNN
jgi:hypothetical protein